MEKSIAQLLAVSKIYQRSGVETRALHKVSFEAHPGELVLILGPSGSGKTTFLTLLAGLQRPTTGDVFIFGKNVNKYSATELQLLRARRIGFIFQTFYLLDSLTSFENIMLVMKFSGYDMATAGKRAEDLLDRFGVKHLKNALPKTLSQGEKQRVAVARALANGADLILADEPTGSLATQQGMIIISFLREIIKSENKCVIISSHDERIRSSADRVIQLSDGEII
jgi:putative ABC transport system ATP-binding protein